MKTLKELRTNKGMTQSQVAAIISTDYSKVSVYESGQAVPQLEDCIILERHFNSAIQWPDDIQQNDRQEIVESIQTLSERYPLQTVLSFVSRWIRQDSRMGNPSRTIKHFSDVSQKINNGPEPLYPVQVKRTKYPTG